jgi:glyoxylase-like metal-dependent hydrolase (beta-lactamase superfamily II)
VFGAPVYVGEADLPVFDDDWYLHAVGPALGRRVWDKPPKPDVLVGVEDGQVLEIGGARFVAYAVPGHTPGSTAWQLRDVLFTGDAVQSPNGDDIYPAPWTVTEDRRQAWRSVRRLLDVDFTTLFDGHHGRADDAKRLIRAALGKLDPDYPYAYPAIHPLGCAESRN